jgi:2-polyprenyl-3-methyl-5-hydroxy-6-metoxy-1,4-benzoquinol methylase
MNEIGPREIPFRIIDRCPCCGGTRKNIIHQEPNTFDPGDPFFGPYQARTISLLECSACSFAFVSELPVDPEFYRRLYSYPYDWATELRVNGKHRVHEHARRSILRVCAGGRLLDVGAAMGAFMRVMEDRFTVEGVEIHEGPAAFARSLGYTVRTGSFLEADLESGYDVISFIDVLEHLPEPAAIMKKAFGLLNPGGVLFIKVPNYKAQLLKQRIARQIGLSKVGIMANYAHINHFSARSLRLLLNRSGFDVLSLQYAPPILWVNNSGLPVHVWIRNVAANAVRVALSSSLTALSSCLQLPLGLNISLLAKKNEGQQSALAS